MRKRLTRGLEGRVWAEIREEAAIYRKPELLGRSRRGSRALLDVARVTPFGLFVLCALFAVALLGSGACAMRARAPGAYASRARFAAAQATLPPPLERSLFARVPGGQLSEDDLQRVLASAPELELPARVGVLPIVPPRDSRGPAPDYQTLPAGVRPLVDTLRRGETFTIVTEMMPIPSGALGMEALREIAARYRLRYVILYRESMRASTSINSAAWGYATVIGALFMSGHTLRVDTQLEASLFDVKTGLLLFTTRRPAHAQMYSTPFGHDDKLESLATAAATKEAPRLAEEVRVEAMRFAEAARRESKQMRASAPAPAKELAAAR